MPRDRVQVNINHDTAHASRVYDYLLGGTDNFEVDRKAAEHVFSAYPGGVRQVRIDVRTNRAFLRRSVRYMAIEAGVRQFLDIGTGIPNADNAHGVALDVAPDSRIVYVDNDPIVLAHAHELLRDPEDGRTAYIDGDFLEPDQVLERAARTLDLDEPVGLVLVGVLHVIPDGEDPHAVVRRFMEALAPGSHLAVSQLTTDVAAENMGEVVKRLDRVMGTVNPPGLRSRAEVARFFDGLEVVAPGVVRGDQWRPDGEVPEQSEERECPLYCGVGRKV